MKIVAAQLNPTIGALEENTANICKAIDRAKKDGYDLIVFPELAICGYPPDDLCLLENFATRCLEALDKVIESTQGIAAIVGTVRPSAAGIKPLRNSAAVIQDGTLLGFQDKALLPTYDVFDEHRYFEQAAGTRVWKIGTTIIGVTICEDIWRESDELVFADYKCDPVAEIAMIRPDILINISASPYSFGKLSIRAGVAQRAARAIHNPCLLCNQVGGNDSLIFDGNSLLYNQKGELVAQAKGFEEDLLGFTLEKLPSPISLRNGDLDDLYSALVLGLRDYFHKSGFQKACLGLSGGVDSALVASIAVDALGQENVLGIAMPSRYSSEGSITDTEELVKNLGMECLTIPIEGPHKAYEELLTPYFNNKPPDTTEENLQARIRGMIIMALSNKHGYIALSTGNKSEMAMGYATLYGDMVGGLGVINDVSKVQVYALCHHLNAKGPRIPEHILTKPPSAELAPGQKDSDTLPDYAIIDAVLADYVEHHLSCKTIAEKRGYPLDLVEDLVQRIHRAEYKRRQSSPGLRVTEKAFSVGRRFPIVQRWKS